jgi:hypothetical protein
LVSGKRRREPSMKGKKMLVLVDLQTQFFIEAASVLSNVASEIPMHRDIALVNFRGCGRCLVTSDWFNSCQRVIRVSKKDVSGAKEIAAKIPISEHLVFGGVYTSECVGETIEDLVAMGYSTEILVPLCCDASYTSPAGTEDFLKKLEDIGVKVVRNLGFSRNNYR